MALIALTRHDASWNGTFRFFSQGCQKNGVILYTKRGRVATYEPFVLLHCWTNTCVSKRVMVFWRVLVLRMIFKRKILTVHQMEWLSLQRSFQIKQDFNLFVGTTIPRPSRCTQGAAVCLCPQTSHRTVSWSRRQGASHRFVCQFCQWKFHKMAGWVQDFIIKRGGMEGSLGKNTHPGRIM